jgi:predicted glycoside hydrolase/deacetylase ChbG (UPF0249 family)
VPSDAKLRPLIVCADDYGIAPGVSRGIRELAEAGRLSATGAMTGMPQWPEAAAAIRPLADRIAVGLHFVLTDQTPLGAMPILAPLGQFPTIATLTRLAITGRLPRDEIAAELARQLEAFTAHLGRPPAFIDGHQHAHQLPVVRDLVLDACVRLGAWVRSCWDRPAAQLRRRSLEGAGVAWLGRGLHRAAARRGVKSNIGFTGAYPFGQIGLAEALPRMLAATGSRPMLMVHPGHPDAALAAVDSWVGPREGEWAYLAGDGFPSDLAGFGLRVAVGAPLPK